MIKMIVTDLDNTLLRSDRQMSDYTLSVLEGCRSRRIKIVYATARSEKASSRFIKKFAPDIFIGYSGALAMADKKVIYRAGIPADMSYFLINDCLNDPDIRTVLAVNETVALSNEYDYSTLGEEASHYKYTDFTLTDYNTSYLKISVISDNPEAVRQVAEGYPSLDLLQSPGEGFYRFVNKTAVKWNALEAALSYSAVKPAQFVVFGNEPGDLEMMENCPHGVAMADAAGEVKNAAKYVCGSCDEDGLAKWIEDMIFTEKI